jgi:hypothetical protein
VISIYIDRVPEQLLYDEQRAGGRRDSPIREGIRWLAETCRTPLRRRAHLFCLIRHPLIIAPIAAQRQALLTERLLYS